MNRLQQRVRTDWSVLAVLLAFALAACVIPTLTNVATTDDWAYARSVEMLVNDGKLQVFSVVAATSVGQVLWGGAFALVFGMSLGVMRLSTVVITAAGAIAFYAILRHVGISRHRSALGVAIYLFNPLSLMLAFTFMTDPHFTSVMVISLALYMRGLKRDDQDWRIVVVASFFAGWAFLIRQQGALIPFAVGWYLLVSRQLWFNRQSILRLLHVAALPVVMLVAYYASLRWINPDAIIQSTFFDQAISTGWDGTWALLRWLTYIELMYAGLLLLPVVLAVLPRSRNLMFDLVTGSRLNWYALLGWLGILGIGIYSFSRAGRRMPYIGQFATLRGLGPSDVPGARKMLSSLPWIPDVVTVIALAAAALVGLILCQRILDTATPERAAAGLLAMVGLWQAIGVLPASYHYINRGGSLDRYLLPLFPVLIALALRALAGQRMLMPVAWVAIAAIGIFSTIGARDYLVYLDAVWDMARTANAMGIENTKIDAGSAWDGYHLYYNAQEQPGTPVNTPNPPWWVRLYARSTDSTYLVSTNPDAHKGYSILLSRPYSAWLENDPVSVYLLKKDNAP